MNASLARLHAITSIVLLSASIPLAAQGIVEGPLDAAWPGFTPLEVGTSCAIEGDLAVFGAPASDLSVNQRGSVLTYTKGASGWVRDQALFVTPTEWDRFGDSVSLDGNWLAVGAPSRSDQALFAGAVYVYENTASGWVLRDTLYASNAAALAQFGKQVALEGNVLAVRSDDAWIHVFERNAGVWSEVGLFSEVGGPNPSLELHVAQGVVLAADAHASGGVGVVRRFSDPGSGWIELTPLDPGTTGLTLFGSGLDSDGNRLMVSSEERVFEFGWTGSDWTVVADFGLQFAGVPYERPPAAVALSGDTVLVGFPLGYGRAFPSEFGVCFAYRRVGSAWEFLARIDPPPSAGLPDLFGIALAADQGRFAVGTPAMFDIVGGAWILEAPAGVDTYAFCEVGAPCGNEAVFGGCAHSLTGFHDAARLSAIGSTSVTADDLVVQGRWLRPSAMTVLFLATQAGASVPFGDGLIAIAGSRARFPLTTSDGVGSVDFGPGLVAQSQGFPAGLQIGVSGFALQALFRDVGGPCGAQFNSTNALWVEFTP